MTQVIVYEDAKKEFLEKTENSVIELTYFKDEKCKEESTKLLGKYCKKTKYSFERTRSPYLSRYRDGLKEDKDLYDILDELIGARKTEILSVDVVSNSSYNPSKWQKLFDKRFKEIIQMEKELGDSVW